jgi:HlyD family secretion protein
MTRHLPFLALLLLTACHKGGFERTFPGTLELNESDAAPLIGGRILAMRVDEGDTVHLGDTIAVLTQANLPAQVEQRRAILAASRARLADLQRGARSPELDRAAADLAAAESEADRTGKELLRAERLAASQIIPEQDLDRARTAAESAARRRDAARASLELMREGSRQDLIRAAAADVRSAEAQLNGANADFRELAVLAASAGVILGRHADPGEVVAAGTPLVTIGDVAHRWVRVYLPAKLLAVLPAGAPAEIVVLSSGVPRLTGRLGAVNPKAEFTPRAALTEEERADLLFAARVELDRPPATLRPGMPVTVTFESVPGQ